MGALAVFSNTRVITCWLPVEFAFIMSHSIKNGWLVKEALIDNPLIGVITPVPYLNLTVSVGLTTVLLNCAKNVKCIPLVAPNKPPGTVLVNNVVSVAELVNAAIPLATEIVLAALWVVPTV